MLDRPQPDVERALLAEHLGEVDDGDAGDDRVETVLEAAQQRGGVGPERDAVERDAGRLLGADPAQDPPDVPHRLGQAVDGVDEIEREEGLAADPGDLAGPVQRQRRASPR